MLVTYETTMEVGDFAWRDATLFVDFDYEPADPKVGMEASVSINHVWIRCGAHLIDMRYYEKEVEPLCWEHVRAEQEREADERAAWEERE